MSSIPLVDLTRQTRSLRVPFRLAVGRVLARGVFILGPELRRFEVEFSRFCGRRFGVGVASGTDALELALRAAGIGPGDRVLTVSFTFLSTVESIRKVGATPVFIDIDPLTYTMDPEQVEAVYRRMPANQRRRVRAILPVHLYGHPCQMDRLGSMVRKHGWRMIEDCAQAHGARWNSTPVGSLGDLGCFSFYPTKNLGAYGDAGMVVTSSRTLARQLKVLRLQGRRQRDWQVVEGLNSRMDEVQAAVLRVKLKRLQGWIERRRRLAALYTHLLEPLPLQLPRESPGAYHVYHLYVIRSRRRAALQEYLASRGIATGIHYRRPVHRQPLYRLSEVDHRCLPVTNRAAEEVLSLPLFPEMRTEELRRVCRAISRFYTS